MMIPFQPFLQARGGFLGREPSPGVSVDRFVELKQVHGNKVLFLKAEADVAKLQNAEADALLSVVPGIPIAVRSADCVPILAAHPGGLVAAVHAGWRGTVAGILEKTLARIQELGFAIRGLRLSIGPAICGACYVVGEEVARDFRVQRGAALAPDAKLPDKYHLDLKMENFRQSVAAGVEDSQIEIREECTRCHEDRFFSHRGALAAGGKNTGRNYSWVMLQQFPNLPIARPQ